MLSNVTQNIKIYISGERNTHHRIVQDSKSVSRPHKPKDTIKEPGTEYIVYPTINRFVFLSKHV